MTVRTLDGSTFAKMVLSGAHHLTNNAKMIDALNVFPVPDGDTGTNMNLSMTEGAAEVKKVETATHVTDVAQALAKGLLMGARGNSGVILSQLFRGFAKGVEGKSSLTPTDFATALDVGVKTAYKAVIKPVEGTILTVARETANDAQHLAESTDDMIKFMEGVIQASKKSLKRTPELLPVLKEVGVVDSGGQGLVTIYEGFLASLKGEKLPDSINSVDMSDMVNAEHHKLAQDYMDTKDIEFGYCTEFMVKFEEDKLLTNPYDEEQFRNELSEFGDSLLVVSDDEIVKVHVHAEHPGEVLNLGQRFGSFLSIKVENMREQHSSIVGNKGKTIEKSKQLTDYAIVSVAMGDGVKQLFESLGSTVVIEGGQTMNPSTQDIAEAIKEANAKNIIILPNNKNIVMAANQAAELAKENVVVVPTKTIPQGMSALLAFHPDATLQENKEAMQSASEQVKTGQVTYAVRDTQIEGMTIENGNFMGLADGKIKATDKDKFEVVKQLLAEMIDENDEIITILQGKDASDEEMQQVQTYIEEAYEDCELEIHKGNQPIYSYIIAIE
ncbi:DAK2 domain-containing protein [Aquibacillus salsiterrae]|uniref:DAK2 domain-containing protein n=1 Tax=Aquibacillus salsiterrae TaxID=2950439 RepID=A0A9X3WD07_9BACI|nr:DAK2 domain-containing protein [Aquibacillus salsiterrae]MDC3416433.1 DAK2 domain-containing protein [Aquibacillus salsiterrae]